MNSNTLGDVPTDPVAGPDAAVPGSRKWKLRLLAVSLPLVLVVLLELVFRVAGLFPDTSARLNPVPTGSMKTRSVKVSQVSRLSTTRVGGWGRLPLVPNATR